MQENQAFSETTKNETFVVFTEKIESNQSFSSVNFSSKIDQKKIKLKMCFSKVFLFSNSDFSKKKSSKSDGLKIF